MTKPSRWCCERKHSTYRFPRTLSIDHDECIMYYLRLCAYYVGEARRWMKRERGVRFVADAALMYFLHDYQRLVAEAEQREAEFAQHKLAVAELRKRVEAMEAG